MVSPSDFQTQYQVSRIADPDMAAFPDRTAVRGGITQAHRHAVIGIVTGRGRSFSAANGPSATARATQRWTV
jgi:hypothetical protein